MIINSNFFPNSKIIPLDKFFDKVLYDKKVGYYGSKLPFGKKGDFVTAPNISNLFSEIIGIWFISTWEKFGKPRRFNIVELGPGDGTLIKIIINVFSNFPEFYKSVNIFLYEKSAFLINKQKINIKNSRVKWIKNFDKIKKGPVIFFGNEFFDAIPIKQFSRKGNSYYEKYYSLNNRDKIDEVFKKANSKDVKQIKKFGTIKNLKFIEFPKLGFDELDKITKKISQNTGGILLIDYGYIKQINRNTLQSVRKHKQNKLLDNLGDADITSLVNFGLLKEYFTKKKLKVKNIVTQRFFLERMGILERADNLSEKMSFKEQSNLYVRLKRLLNKKLMGNLFKVIYAFKFNKNNFLGFK